MTVADISLESGIVRSAHRARIFVIREHSDQRERFGVVICHLNRLTTPMGQGCSTLVRL